MQDYKLTPCKEAAQISLDEDCTHIVSLRATDPVQPGAQPMPSTKPIVVKGKKAHETVCVRLKVKDYRIDQHTNANLKPFEVTYHMLGHKN